MGEGDPGVYENLAEGARAMDCYDAMAPDSGAQVAEILDLEPADLVTLKVGGRDGGGEGDDGHRSGRPFFLCGAIARNNHGD